MLLFLAASGLPLSEQSLKANGNVSPELQKDSSPLSPTKQRVSEPQPPGLNRRMSPKKEIDEANQVATSPTPAVAITQLVADSEKDRAVNKPRQSFADGFAPQTWANWAQVIVAAVGLFFIWLTIRAMRDQVKVGQDTASSALEEAKAITAAERAYVKMSHLPPGLSFGPISGNYWIPIRVENLGRTPARITATVIKTQYFSPAETLPKNPDYSGAVTELGKAFLITHDHVGTTVTGIFKNAEIEGAVRAGHGRWVIFGYVDYIDQFGRHHRAG